MIDELTKTFFDTFGIEPNITSCYHRCKKDLNCKECNEAEVIYPTITDTHYLQLLCLFTKEMNCFTVYDEDVNGLKEAILKDFILDNGYFSKQQVQELFKECE